ncbi:MAG TPA: ATP synthase F0 subunit B [Bryobacteraceae bacterium]|nr:ATP synthase F0 subunit B [Bryobacteraceae bacterium]
MKRTFRLVTLVVFLAVLAFGQEEKKEGGEGGGILIWKWANFGLLAVALVYVIGKKAPMFFAARSEQIGKDMAEAAEERRKADERAAAVDRRLTNLEAEIAALRAESKQQAEAETRRLTEHTAAEIAKIQAHAEQEIVSAGKAARLELKRHAAELAIGLAEQKIRARLTPEGQDGLVRSFVRDIK